MLQVDHGGGLSIYIYIAIALYLDKGLLPLYFVTVWFFDCLAVRTMIGEETRCHISKNPFLMCEYPLTFRQLFTRCHRTMFAGGLCPIIIATWQKVWKIFLFDREAFEPRFLKAEGIWKDSEWTCALTNEAPRLGPQRAWHWNPSCLAPESFKHSFSIDFLTPNFPWNKPLHKKMWLLGEVQSSCTSAKGIFVNQLSRLQT